MTKPETQIVHSFPVGREEGSLAFLQRQRVFSRLLARALSFSRQQQQQRLCPSASMASQRRTVRWVFFFFSSSISLSEEERERKRIGRVFSFCRLLLATFLLRPSHSLPPPPCCCSFSLRSKEARTLSSAQRSVSNKQRERKKQKTKKTGEVEPQRHRSRCVPGHGPLAPGGQGRPLGAVHSRDAHQCQHGRARADGFRDEG